MSVRAAIDVFAGCMLQYNAAFPPARHASVHVLPRARRRRARRFGPRHRAVSTGRCSEVAPAGARGRAARARRARHAAGRAADAGRTVGADHRGGIVGAGRHAVGTDARRRQCRRAPRSGVAHEADDGVRRVRGAAFEGDRIVAGGHGVAARMEKAVAGAAREQRDGASGKWVAHWKMVRIVRPMWQKIGAPNQLGRKFPALSYTEQDSDGLTLLEKGPTTIRGARNLLSVALQYGNAFLQGMQAAALKPADFFGNDDILYLMEDMATGEIRLSILWEWVHKGAILSEDDTPTGTKSGDVFSIDLFERLLKEEYDKLLKAHTKDVFDSSKTTTLPISGEIVLTYIYSEQKFPWFIDLLNINLDNVDLATAKERIDMYMNEFNRNGTRITENVDFKKRIEIK